MDPYFARFLPQVALAVIVPPVVLLRIGLADWISALILAVTLPLIPVFLVLIGLHTRRRTARQWRLLAQLGGHFLDVVEGLPTLKVFGRAKAQAATIRRITDEQRQATMATLRVAFLSALVLELLATVGTALVAVAVGLRLLRGLSELLHGAAGPAARTRGLPPAPRHGHASSTPAWRVSRRPGRRSRSSTSRRRRSGPMPVGSSPTGRPGTDAAAVDLGRDAVEFCNVSLRYPDRTDEALRGVDLAVAPGSLTVLVGESGAGKSSLLDTAAPLRGAHAGVTSASAADVLGGLPLPGLAPAARLGAAGTAPVRRDAGRQPAARPPRRHRRRLWEAVERAGAAGSSWGPPCRPRHCGGRPRLRLSAGQRQRVALARAFLRDAPLLLLDEPTAHLDPLTAAALRGAVERLMVGRTVLLVTHHRAWLDSADAVVTLRNGQVVPPR